jgi:soluble lytic murein transglycosylase-like protein
MALKLLQFRIPSSLLKMLVQMSICFSPAAQSELYLHEGLNGERMVSDRPVAGYVLLTKRDTLTGAGDFLANRAIDRGTPAEFKAHILNASRKYMVDPALVEAIIQVESNFRSDAVSRSGATGLMQLMPGTARDLDVMDRFNPRDNIHGGVKYISELMKRFNYNMTLVIAAYNAGPSAVERHNGVPPNAETPRYVKKVFKAYHDYKINDYGAD